MLDVAEVGRTRGMRCGLAQGSPWSKCLKQFCEALGRSGRKKPVLGGGESWGDAALAAMSVVEALPFCHRNICFNTLCFFPDRNHLNCVY